MSMKRTRHIVLLTAMLGLVSACTTTTRQAPVVDRSPVPVPAEPAKPVAAEQPKADKNGYYTVKKGDTLLHIALDFGQNYRDIVAWNKLADPNDIKVDQVLRVLPPDEAANGVKTSPIAMPTEPKPPVKKPAPKVEKKPDTIADAKDKDKDKDGKEDKSTVSVAAATPAPTPAPAVTPPAATPAPTGIVPGATVTATDDERLSWMWPADGRIVATFDEGKNKGIDIAGRAGQGVMAAGAGRVMYAGSGIRGYGNLVIVKHSNSLLSAYAHNRTILVKEGQSVAKGDKIAEMGDSDSDTVKLHFEIRQQGKPVDPSKFLPNR
jgi:lipoprotein NlpD